MRKQFITACLYTLVTTVLLGLGYPLAVTGLAHLLMPAESQRRAHHKRWRRCGLKIDWTIFHRSRLL